MTLRSWIAARAATALLCRARGAALALALVAALCGALFMVGRAGPPLPLGGAALALASNYERSVANVLVSEGCAYENHPQDPGGPTKCGITLADVRRYLKPGATADDVRALTEEQARAIYRAHYWNHPCVRGDDLPLGLDYTNFDYGVNSGVGRPGKVLRRELGLPDDSCVVTDRVLAAVKARRASAIITAVNAERRRFLRGLRTYQTFGRGWERRVDSVDVISHRMAGPASAWSGRQVLPAYGPGKAYGPDAGMPDDAGAPDDAGPP